jgi:Ca2+-binding EF-hand superfamily protein
MSKKVLLIAGVLLAAGSVAAISAPHFRGGRGAGFGDGGGVFGPMNARFGERLKAMDANQDGVITVEEFLGRRDATLARLDRNGDGAIDATEFEAMAKEGTDYRAKRFMKRFDADRDGKVTKEEFSKSRRDRFAWRDLNDDGRIGLEDMPPSARERAGRWADRAKEAQESKDGKEAQEQKGGRGFTLERILGRSDRQFSRLDRNGDGVIDMSDLQSAASERMAFASQRFFRRYDADRDGKVSRDEFNRSARERFVQLDLDDDGKITEADLPPMMRGRGFLK